MSSSPQKIQRLKRGGGRLVSLGWLTSRLGAAGVERLLNVFRGNVQKGSLEFHLPGGDFHRIEGREPGPKAEIVVHRWRGVRRLITGGGLGLAQGYIDGDWTSPNLVAVMELGAANTQTLGPSLTAGRWIRALHRLKHFRRANTRSGAKRNIAFHYDLGNDFYSQWLDPTMTYSSGLWHEQVNSLEVAQKHKYRRLLDLLEVRPGDHILEIGCGWGGFAETAAIERGARVTGITLSREQLAYAQGRIKQADLADQVTLQFGDYRDVEETFDHVVSIEMFEAVGEKHWPAYFKKIHQVLKPGGRAALQIITIDDRLFAGYRETTDFIQTYIFPGGMLPSLQALKGEVGRAGLSWQGAQNFGAHYARTLAEWRRRFERAWQDKSLPKGFDDNFRQIWTYYFSYCEGGFRGGSIDVYQLALQKGE